MDGAESSRRLRASENSARSGSAYLGVNVSKRVVVLAPGEPIDVTASVWFSAERLMGAVEKGFPH